MMVPCAAAQEAGYGPSQPTVALHNFGRILIYSGRATGVVGEFLDEPDMPLHSLDL
jgi:hypothetical protein